MTSIYLVWQTDEWLSYNSRVLAYVGESYEDCCAQIKAECSLSDDDYRELCDNGQVRRTDDGFFIEEQPLNAFHPDFN